MKLKLKNGLLASFLIMVAMSSYAFFLWNSTQNKPDEAAVSISAEHKIRIDKESMNMLHNADVKR